MRTAQACRLRISENLKQFLRSGIVLQIPNKLQNSKFDCSKEKASSKDWNSNQLAQLNWAIPNRPDLAPVADLTDDVWISNYEFVRIPQATGWRIWKFQIENSNSGSSFQVLPRYSDRAKWPKDCTSVCSTTQIDPGHYDAAQYQQLTSIIVVNRESLQ